MLFVEARLSNARMAYDAVSGEGFMRTGIEFKSYAFSFASGPEDPAVDRAAIERAAFPDNAGRWFSSSPRTVEYSASPSRLVDLGSAERLSGIHSFHHD